MKREPLDPSLNPFLDLIADDDEADDEEPSISDADEGSDSTQPVVEDEGSDQEIIGGDRCERSVFLLHCSFIFHHSHSVMGEAPPSEGSEANEIDIDNTDHADPNVDAMNPAHDAPAPRDGCNTDEDYLAPLFSGRAPIT